jgi:hypothetical protein
MSLDARSTRQPKDQKELNNREKNVIIKQVRKTYYIFDQFLPLPTKCLSVEQLSQFPRRALPAM